MNALGDRLSVARPRVGLATLIVLISTFVAGCVESSQVPSPTAATAEHSPPATPVGVLVPGVTPATGATPIPLPNVAQVSASADALWVLVGGDRLFSSADRGDSWTARGVPPSLSGSANVTFVDATRGWLGLVGTPTPGCGQQSFLLWGTQDAGATWVLVPADGIAPERCKGRVVFVDELHGYLVASAEGEVPLVYRSNDGGRTWEASDPLPLPSEFMDLADAPELSPGEVRAFGATLLLPVASASAQYVYRSTDGGATWTPGARIDAGGAALALVSPTRWLLVGPESQETLDAGVTWHAFATDYAQAAPVPPQVTFGSAEIGYATVRGTLQRTSDGGAHWTAIATPGTAS